MNSDVNTTSLRGKVAVVTGAAGGIGSAITRRLAEAGCSVVLTFRSSQAEAEALAKGLPGDHAVLPLQVGDSRGAQALAEEVRGRYGRLDLLVNNAGMTRYVAHDDLDGLDDELIDQIFRTNWRGAFACIRAFKDLLAEGDGGLVVNISSIAGTTGEGSNVAYCASKAALDSMTRSLAWALAPQIRVVSVAPGLVEGDYAQKLDPAWRQAQIERTPLHRLARAEDVANAVLALATLLPFTTGDIIHVDGGRPLS